MSSVFVAPNPSLPISGPVGSTDLRVVQQASLLLALSNGTIQGPAHPNSPFMDVYLNDTPIQNPDGSYNFNGTSMAYTLGTLTQGVMSGFTDAESLIVPTSPLPVTYAQPAQISIPEGPTTAIRVNIYLPSLFIQDFTNNGAMSGDMVQLSFQLSCNGSSFQDVTTWAIGGGLGGGAANVITGQTTGAVATSYLIPVASIGPGPWILQVSRVTADNTGTYGAGIYHSNLIYVPDYSLVADYNLQYPMTALLGVNFDAMRFASIPKVSMLMRGIKVLVPSNYIPASYGSVSLGVVITSNAPMSVNASTNTITRTDAGSFITDGVMAGQVVSLSGFANGWNNGSFNVTAVTASTITVTVNGPNPLSTCSSTPSCTLYTCASPSVEVQLSSLGSSVVVNGFTVTIGTQCGVLTRNIGNFVSDGFTVGMYVRLRGFAQNGSITSSGNNNGNFVVAAVTTTTLTLISVPTSFGLAPGLGTLGMAAEPYGTSRLINSLWQPATYATTGFGTSGGAWDGTFGNNLDSTLNEKVWTSNPAWIFMDMCLNNLYGCGKYLNQMGSNQAGINKWQLYQLAQYCDTMVSDGFGGQEPRFQFNGYIQSADEAFKLLAHIISCARAQLYYGGGQVNPVQDIDQAPVSLFTPSNVKNGKFTYQGTARKARHTVCNVTWNDPSQLWTAVPEQIYADAADVSRYGIQTTSLVAYGCTSRGQSRRMGRWLLLSELNELEAVTFTTGIEGVASNPGDIILIQDPARKRVRQGGRIVSSTTTQVSLDGPVTLGAGPYTLYVQLATGALVSTTVTNTAGTYTVLNISPAFTTAPVAQAQWLLTSSATTATRWRILSIKETQEKEDKSYLITALSNYEAKYALCDSTDSMIPNSASSAGSIATPPVTNVVVSSNFVVQADRVAYTLHVSWSAPTSATPTSYAAQYQLTGGPWTDMVIAGNGAAAVDVPVGSYAVRVCAMYPQGPSPYSEVPAFTILNSGVSPVENLELSVSGFATTGQLSPAMQATAASDYAELYQDYLTLVAQVAATGLAASNYATLTTDLTTLHSYLVALGFTTTGLSNVSPITTNLTITASGWSGAWNPVFADIQTLETTIATQINNVGTAGLSSGSNLIPNWDSELGVVAGVGGNLVTNVGAGNGYLGSTYVRAMAPSGTSKPLTGNIPVFPGDTFQLSAFCNSVTTLDGTGEITASFYDINGNPVNVSQFIWSWLGSPTTGSINSWQQMWGYTQTHARQLASLAPLQSATPYLNITVPSASNIVSMVLSIASAASLQYFDNIQLIKLAAPASAGSSGAPSALGLVKPDGTTIVAAADGTLSAVSGSTTQTFTFTQLSASATWNITHNLGRFPAVSFQDANGNQGVCQVEYVDDSHITLTFGSPQIGYAYLN